MNTLYRILFIVLSILLNHSIIASIITVKQDGSGNYTLIQPAVNQAMTGDTVLVWPGTYYENIDFLGKNITLASLALTSGDESYKYTTIIDGNSSGSCMVLKSNEIDVLIQGFTLQNGSGYLDSTNQESYGGGIYLSTASASIKNCIIKNNKASHFGGGIYCNWYVSLILSGTSILCNHAYGVGGLGIGYECAVVFDSLDKCSIYNNYAGIASDISHGNESFLMEIILDTFSVSAPTNFFIFNTDNNNEYSFDADHAFIIPIDADLYVNPISGDNNNSGLSPEEPLKTISFALASIAIDSLNLNTIHLLNGYYCDSTNNERFPLNLRPYTNITGESRDGVIIDGRYQSKIFYGNNGITNYNISKLTAIRAGHIKYNGYSFNDGFGLFYNYGHELNISFDSLLVERAWNSYAGSLHAIRSNTTVSNCEFVNSIGGSGLRLGTDENDTSSVINCMFIDNMPDFDNPEYSLGKALSTLGRNGNCIVTGSLFTGNNRNAITNWVFNNLYLVNCTFSNNTNIVNTGSSIGNIDANMYMYNCISYNDGLLPISLTTDEAVDSMAIEIYSSNIEGGIESISLSGNFSKLVYDESNIDLDPIFYGGHEFPFNLADNSPCIDAGTLELPEFLVLPEKDLAGNPRIWNGNIDMGAYEWNPTVGYPDFPEFEDKITYLSVAPNPFTIESSITVKHPKQGHILVELFDNKGYKIKKLIDKFTIAGTTRVEWNANESDFHLPTGLYHIVMSIDGKKVESLKVVKL